MSHLNDHELQQLIEHAQAADRALRPIRREYEPLAPRVMRLLQEMKTLRDQAAEREHLGSLEHGG